MLRQLTKYFITVMACFIVVFSAMIIIAVSDAIPNVVTQDIITSIWVMMFPWLVIFSFFVITYLLPVFIFNRKNRYIYKWWTPVLVGGLPLVLILPLSGSTGAALLLIAIGIVIAITFWSTAEYLFERF